MIQKKAVGCDSSLCGRRWIRTTEGKNQQIYSLPHLATLVFAHCECKDKNKYVNYATLRATFLYLFFFIFAISYSSISYNATSFLLQSVVAFKAVILSAVAAHSLPLLPITPPARSYACCMLLVVMTPNITGTCVCKFNSVTPCVTLSHT